jgi:hypothetical protein
MKWQLTWADHFYGLLMKQQVTEKNMLLASSAVGAWLGEKVSTTIMSDDKFGELLTQAIEELESYAWDRRGGPVDT